MVYPPFKKMPLGLSSANFYEATLIIQKYLLNSQITYQGGGFKMNLLQYK
jgi:hypothetical protein